MTRWTIHYDDREPFRDADGLPEDAPCWGVQVIAQAAGSDIGRGFVHLENYYWYDRGEWFGGDLLGLADYLTRSQGRSVVKFGRIVSQAVYERSLREAIADPYLPKKIAWRQSERRMQERVEAWGITL